MMLAACLRDTSLPNDNTLMALYFLSWLELLCYPLTLLGGSLVAHYFSTLINIVPHTTTECKYFGHT